MGLPAIVWFNPDFPNPVDRNRPCNLTLITQQQWQVFLLAKGIRLTCAQHASDHKNELWLSWSYADLVYAQGTVYAYGIVIGIFSIWYLLQRVGLGQVLPLKVKALSRFLASRRYSFGSWQSPTLGVVVLLMLLVTFTFAMSFAARPYHWYACLTLFSFRD